jgi:hypothetical protein
LTVGDRKFNKNISQRVRILPLLEQKYNRLFAVDEPGSAVDACAPSG